MTFQEAYRDYWRVYLDYQLRMLPRYPAEMRPAYASLVPPLGPAFLLLLFSYYR